MRAGSPSSQRRREAAARHVTGLVPAARRAARRTRRARPSRKDFEPARGDLGNIPPAVVRLTETARARPRRSSHDATLQSAAGRRSRASGNARGAVQRDAIPIVATRRSNARRLIHPARRAQSLSIIARRFAHHRTILFADIRRCLRVRSLQFDQITHRRSSMIVFTATH
jgi:hypothetical protein